MEITISDFHTIFYIPDIKKLDFHLPRVCILGTNHYGEMRRTDFKQRRLFQDVICRCDYAERVNARFAYQIKLEYYDGNRSVSIKGIALEHFIALPKTDINSTTSLCQLHALFHSF